MCNSASYAISQSLSEAPDRKNVHRSWSASHIRSMCLQCSTTLSLCEAHRSSPRSWEKHRVKTGDCEKINGSVIRGHIGIARFPNWPWMCVGPWQVERESVFWDSGEGEAANWSCNKGVIVSWLDWLRTSVELRAVEVAFILGPSMTGPFLRSDAPLEVGQANTQGPNRAQRQGLNSVQIKHKEM